jgi:TetR/AcrR family transcriptional repressor of bet genes
MLRREKAILRGDMPKLGMGPVRRTQLIEAAISSLHDYGYADTTVARIAKKAGVSSGIVHHYFNGKDDLLFATMQYMLRELRAETLKRLKQAANPRERLSAIIEANFAPSQYSPDVMTAWLALYGSARQSAHLTRILRLYDARLKSNLRHALRQLTDEATAEELGIGVSALIDGVWLRAALLGDTYNRETAIHLVQSYVACQLPGKH